MDRIFKVEITPKTIFTILFILALIYLAVILKSVLFIVFLAFSISAMISPIVNFLYKRNVPKNVAITLIYFLFFSSLILLVLAIYKPFMHQLENFIKAFPQIFVNVLTKIIDRIPMIRDNFNWDEILSNVEGSFWENIEISNLSEYLLSGIGTAFGLVGSFFGILINFLSTILLSYYFIQFRDGSKEKLTRFIPPQYQKRAISFIQKVEDQLGAWLRAQILLMLIIGILSWFGLEIIGMDFSIPLGIIAGFLEAIPSIGPFITFIVALIVGIGSQVAAWKIVFIMAWFLLIQQLENMIIVPKLMEKVVGTNPLLIIIALLSAAKVFGPWGTLLAVPIVAILQISISSYLEHREEENNLNKSNKKKS